MMRPVVLITGASGGIGLETAKAFAAAGWHVLAASRTPEALASIGEVQAIRCDPCRADDRRAVAELIASDFEGRLDCLVNNAGYAQSGPVELIDEAAWREQLDVNLMAPALLTAGLLPSIRQAGGAIINVSSVLGRVGYAWQGAYCASKFGLEGWSESLMLETQGQGIRVHLIQPGVTRSSFGQRLRRTSAQGVYRHADERFSKLREDLAKRAQPAEKVARRVLQTATAANAPFRQAVGGDARMAALVQRCLPEGLYIGLSRMLARKLFALGQGRS